MRLRSKVMDLAKPLKKGTPTATKKVKPVAIKKKSTVDSAALREQVKAERANVKEARTAMNEAGKAYRAMIREFKAAERLLAKAQKALDKAGVKPRGRPRKA